jgi:uncharacterized protein YndB with AHSA1/START domain
MRYLNPKLEIRSLYKENSERRKRDSFPEGEVVEYIPNKKIAYTWQQSDIPDFTRPQ